ncbi:MAG TPA: RodZ domain-containing protein [Anaerolineales bacterium]
MTQTIGQRLKAEREEQRLTLEKVFEATRIRLQYLQALEADDLSVMPSPVQARGYLRNYAEYLGFDIEQIFDEIRAMSAQPPSEEVIGPADESASAPQQAKASLDIPSVTPTLESIGEDKPDHIEELTVPTKPKPARRIKKDSHTSQPKPALLESTTKRRGSKKVESESFSIVDTQSEIVEESVAPIERISQLEPSPVFAPGTSVVQSQSEPVANEGINISQEPFEQTDVSDTLWQTWLNRLGSVLSARMKRRTLNPKESPILENEPIVAPIEPGIALEAEAQNHSLNNSDEIFKEVGNELRVRRELLSLHFDEVERNTHVKAHYLDALERGALDELPSTVQTRGMLSNYATFLDLDVDTLLLRFADALQARHRERNPQKPARKPGQPIIANIPPVRNIIAGDMVFGVSMAILLVGFAIWGVSRVMEIQSQREVKPTAPSISDVLLGSPNPAAIIVTPTFLPVESFPGEATVTIEIPTQNVNAAVQLNLVAVERTYMRVVVDGKVAFDGRVVPGNAYPFEAENQIEVLVGSGAAIRIVYNGRDLGLMGSFGQVVNNIYLGTEIITPTALPTTTATITVTPTQTVAPTSTLKPTRTPVPSTTPVP